jgi:DNA polymerase-2
MATHPRGFILQASYRVVSQPNGERVPVVHLYGRLENGGTFLVRDDRQRPHFYIRAADQERARTLRIPVPQQSDQHTFAGEPVCRIDAEAPSDIPPMRDRLHAIDVETFEADVRFAIRYLIERGIKGGCEIEGDSIPGKGIDQIFDNPILRPAKVRIEPRVLSFDIETDPKGERLLAIAVYGPQRNGIRSARKVLPAHPRV